MLKGIVTEIVGDIMDNIRKQILQKMKSLDVVVKEPLNRRASYDDYNLCFENFNKKQSMFPFGENVQQGDQTGNGSSRNGNSIFINNPNLNQLKNKPKKKVYSQFDYEEDSSSSSMMS